MTMGPEPMTRTWLMSLRLGMSYCFLVVVGWFVVVIGGLSGLVGFVVGHEGDELVEEWVGVVGAGSGFGVVLHRVGES